jgi:phage shock protein PspC (stress-responsive transcriptional regulator)
MNQNHGVPQPPNQGYGYNNYQPRKLYRSTRDKWIGGVCGGIAERYNHDPTVIRILWIVLTIFTLPVGIIAYILLWIFVQKYPSYFTPPPPPQGAESVHYHYYYKSSKQNKTEE